MEIYEFDGIKYTTARELYYSLGYVDASSLNRVISRNKDLIGEALVKEITNFEGTRDVVRKVPLYSFEQVLVILKKSRLTSNEAINEIYQYFGKEKPKQLESTLEAALLKTLNQVFDGITEVKYQHKIGKYITNFYFPQYKLIVQLDGPEYKSSIYKEAAKMMNEDMFVAGYNILRFSNKEKHNIIVNQILKDIFGQL